MTRSPDGHETAPELFELLQLAVNMRKLQRIYYGATAGSDEKRAALVQALAAERKFDNRISQLRHLLE